MPKGRPSEYTPEILEQAKLYLTEYKNKGEVIPSIEGLAIYIGKARETVRVWAKEEEKEDFSAIVEEVLALQARELTNKGLSGDFSAPITKLLLSKHGYHEKQEVETNGNITIKMVKFNGGDNDTP